MLISPAEPHDFLILSPDHQYSSEPEKFGVDFISYPRGLRVGSQRKTCSDLVASIRGDRIARELGQMAALDQAVVIVEGDWKWDKDDRCRLRGHDHGFTRAQYDGICMALQANGVWVLTSPSITGTIDLLRRIERFLSRDDHRSLFTRPKASSERWGTARNRDFGIHLLQSFDGVSHVTAAAVYDHFDGVPLRWLVDEPQLRAVQGVGAKRAQSMLAALPQNGASSETNGQDGAGMPAGSL